MRLVVDASVALKWILDGGLPEPNRQEAANLLETIGDGVHEAIQPIHWRVEVLAVVARLDAKRIEPAMTLLYDFPCEIADGVALEFRAARLAVSLNHHCFDTLYHAVALEHGATLVTADERYFEKARQLGAITSLKEFGM